MLRLTLAVFFLIACSMMSVAEQNDFASGVPRDLARWRAAHYSDVHYALSVKVGAGASLLIGTEEIRVTLDDTADRIILDWRASSAAQGEAQANVQDIEINGRKTEARAANDHLILVDGVMKGENVIRLHFTSPIATSGSAVTRYMDREDNSEYVYTLFVPSDASTAFPCFDQPDLKARFQLQTETPETWKVVTNTSIRDEFHTASRGANNSVNRIVQRSFRETQPISTYLFAFAAGPFAEFHEEDATAQERERLLQATRQQQATFPIRIFVRKSQIEKAKKELSELFRMTRADLAFLAKYFDFKFPFTKYDQVLIPEFAYGGMEHAGATFLREDRILFPTDPTSSDLINRAEVMFHEAAHQWFGDLVTMRWFDDLWLKEGFATFMAYKAMEQLMPQYNAWKVFYQKTKPGAYETDATKGTTPIFQEIGNLSAAKSAYGNIVYRKAPSMLRQAEFFLGPAQFQRAVRMFLREHAYANAEWADLVHDFERVAGRRLDEWANAWVKRRGMADARVEWSTDSAGRINRFVLKQSDVLQEGGGWPMRVKVLLAHSESAPEVLTVTMNGAGETIVAQAMGKRRPDFVFANYEDYGYGRFLLDEKSRDYVLNHLGALQDDFLRALLWGSLWDSVREAELAPADYIELAIKQVERERDDVTVQSITGRVRVAFNYYLSDAQRQQVAPRLERLIFDRMMNAETPGLRITYFRAYQSIAMTDEGRANLKKILRGELIVPGMTLRSRDRFDIITALLARDDRDAPSLLEQQSAADVTDDGRRYTYAAGAARRDAETKKKYFDAYMHDQQLPESWIEASAPPFNMILQSDLTLPYLAPALEMLPTLKRTRKIFFINNWLGAFLGGQCSNDALTTVQNFLERTPALDRDLRLKVLENVAPLERCVRIRTKYAG
ncbi:MAG TPA: M1 family aminopeptidase [Pyrinomonadaceae bacterium]|nr:M1 family aminopeptidase [Pyrinomonadaceae bacterium]